MTSQEHKQTKVICDHYGGPECGDCKFNKTTNGEAGKKFFCQNAMNDMSGDTVKLIKA